MQRDVIIACDFSSKEETLNFLDSFKEEKPYRIYKDNDVYVVSGEEIEKLLRMTKFTDEEARRFAKKLRRMGVDEDLQKMGIQEGDTVRILDFEFEYKE